MPSLFQNGRPPVVGFRVWLLVFLVGSLTKACPAAIPVVLRPHEKLGTSQTKSPPAVSKSPVRSQASSFTTYSFFLFPSSEWVDQNEDLKTLYKAFRSFGDAIGAQHVAVWYVAGDGKAVDVERGKAICDLLRLNYNDGPYIVLTRQDPEAGPLVEKPLVVQLCGIPAGRAVRILNIIEQDLRTTGAPRPARVLWEEMKQRLPRWSELIAVLLGKI